MDLLKDFVYVVFYISCVHVIEEDIEEGMVWYLSLSEVVVLIWIYGCFRVGLQELLPIHIYVSEDKTVFIDIVSFTYVYVMDPRELLS